jgi:ring-1,2-phenylacetyl-CoA epoxidase subunit PaaE
VLEGRRTTFPVAGGSILEAALRARPDAPYACKGGVCGTCRCRVLEGRVAMDHAYALEEDEIEAGVVLACQSHPRSERIVLDFDAR